jgi:hypothetical protein
MKKLPWNWTKKEADEAYIEHVNSNAVMLFRAEWLKKHRELEGLTSSDDNLLPYVSHRIFKLSQELGV